MKSKLYVIKATYETHNSQKTAIAN